jgi:hypothetical protein
MVAARIVSKSRWYAASNSSSGSKKSRRGHQSKVGRVLYGEADVAHADGPVPIESGVTGLAQPPEQGGLKSLQGVGGERRQQGGLVGEMARRCPVRDAGPAGEVPKAEPADPTLPNRFRCLLEEDLTKVPVVVGQIQTSVGSVLTVPT